MVFLVARQLVKNSFKDGCWEVGFLYFIPGYAPQRLHYYVAVVKEIMTL
jgi:hypothetical protein